MHRSREQGEVWGLPGYARSETLDLSDLIGIPYGRLGRDPEKELDCTGLLIEVWRRMEVEISDPLTDPVGAEKDFVEVETRRFGDSLCVDLRGDGLEEHVAIYVGIGLCIHVHRSRGTEVIPVRNLEGEVIATMRKTEFAEDR